MGTETVSTDKLEEETGLRWGVERRLIFLEQRLFWDGTVNRNDLMGRFGVSINQASADIARYQAMASGNMVYDTRAKRYVAGTDFAPKLSKPDAERYLAELRARREGLLEDAAALFTDLPQAEIVPSPLRPLDPELVRGIVGAIKERSRIAVTYQSFSSPRPRERLLEPHSLAHDGLRWHARAHDCKNGDFRDYTLGRMKGLRVVGPAASEADRDHAWNRIVTLVLGVHPEASPEQAASIRADYGFGGETHEIRIREALAFYFKRRLRLDLDWRTQPLQVQHVVLIEERV